MNALGRTNGVGVSCLGESANIVGPHACSVDHNLGAHGDFAIVGANNNAIGAASRVFRDAHDRALVCDSGAMIGSGACHGEAQPGIVGARVVIQVSRGQSFGVHGWQVLKCSGLAQALVQFADAPSAGEVVHPH